MVGFKEVGRLRRHLMVILYVLARILWSNGSCVCLKISVFRRGRGKDIGGFGGVEEAGLEGLVDVEAGVGVEGGVVLLGIG